MEELIQSAINTWGIPTAITGLFFWLLKCYLSKQDKKREQAEAEREKRLEEKEDHREKLDKTLIQSVNAALALSEATARAVQRIPDAHCNGDMHDALDYATRVKHEQKEFLTELGVHSLHED